MRNRTIWKNGSLPIAVIAAIALLAAACGTSPSGRASSTSSTSVPPARNSATTGGSRGFDVYNLSGTPVTFASASEYTCGFGVCNGKAWDSAGPANGHQLQPGQADHF